MKQLSVLVLALLSVGCTGEAPAAAGPSITYAASQCGRCIDHACSSEIQACDEEPDCSSYLLCLGQCQNGADGNIDAGCEANCRASVSAGSPSLIERFTLCRKSGAGAACPECQTIAAHRGLFDEVCPTPIAQTPPLSACGFCRQKRCCESIADCDNNPACAAIVAGILSCIDNAPPNDLMKCALKAYDMNTDGRAQFRKRDLCITTNCRTECQGPPDPDNPQKRAECPACEAAKCEEQVRRTIDTKECLNSYSCAYTCDANDKPCVAQCIQDRETCTQKYLGDLIDCDTYRCRAQC